MNKTYIEARAEFDKRIAARRREETRVIIMVPTPPKPVNEGPVRHYRILKRVGDVIKPVAFVPLERDADIFIASQPDKLIRDAEGELIKVSFSKVREN